MRRREFLGLTAGAMSAPQLVSRTGVFVKSSPARVQLRVQPDGRIHNRMFPPPPIALREDLQGGSLTGIELGIVEAWCGR